MIIEKMKEEEMILEKIYLLKNSKNLENTVINIIRRSIFSIRIILS